MLTLAEIRIFLYALCLASALVAAPTVSRADVIHVAEGGDPQAAIDAAQPGDTILLEGGATFLGNFTLPAKEGSTYITIRTAVDDAVLPGAGRRIDPTHAALLAKIGSHNTMSALRTQPGAHHWRLQYLEFLPNQEGYSDIIKLGDGSSDQSSLSQVPYAIEIRHCYIHGDPAFGQKRGIALNSGSTEIRDSYISDIKAVGMDTQAIGRWNGPGPYVILNNYLEAAGENIMFGGADPHIPDLIPSDIHVEGNHLSKPVAWRSAIVPPPTNVAATASYAGGTLAAAIYYYRVVARADSSQGSTATSPGSAEVAASVPGSGSGSVRISWAPVAGAKAYRVYGRKSGGQNAYWTVTGTSFTDTGQAGTPGSVPSSGTLWSVKNLFELKNARNVTIQRNLMEYNWKASQIGYAVLFKAANQSGRCTWCVVENVTFRYNVVRNVAGGISILGQDYNDASGQVNHLTIQDNLFVISKQDWGGTGAFLNITEGPRDVIVDHNTIVHDGATLIVASGGESVYGFQYTNNISKHGRYGIKGDGLATGNQTLDAYFPGALFLANVLAGGKASAYPAGNHFPPSGEFSAQFVDLDGGNYQLADTSLYRDAGTDSRDIGADVGQLEASTVPNVAPTADPGGPYASLSLDPLVVTGAGSTDDDGVIMNYVWNWGDGTADTSASQPQATHEFARPGTYVITVSVVDDDGDAASATTTVEVGNRSPLADAGGPYTAATEASLVVSAAASLDLDGSITQYAWHFHDEVVLYASDVSNADIHGRWVKVDDAGAAGRVRLANADAGDPKVKRALAAPVNYVDVRFTASAGVPYHLWLRMRAANDAYENDSVFVQFSGAVDEDGHPIYRMGTTDAMGVVLEEGSRAGRAGWGWNDNDYGDLGTPVYFNGDAVQTMRIQQREDGISFDQVVLSANTYLTQRPGELKNDALIVDKGLGTANGAAPAHRYRHAGKFPLTLGVVDDLGATAAAVTSVSVTQPSLLTADRAPVANPGGPYSVAAGQLLQLDGSAYDPDGGHIANYLWQFHDEVVIHAGDVPNTGIFGRWLKVADSEAAGGVRLENTDAGDAKINAALAMPANYVDVQFFAVAGVPYHLWLRMRAADDHYANDSVYVQFSDAVDASGNPLARLGTTSAMAVVLEDSAGAGRAGWGWNDNGWASLGLPVYFAVTGLQTLRVQQREDGVSFDQIVLSANTYYEASPGALKLDATIVPQSLGTATGVAPTHTYRLEGTYPVWLQAVDDEGVAATGTTTVTVH